MKDIFTLHCPSLPLAKVAAFKGVEGISKPYRFQVDLLLPGDEWLDMEDIVGTRARLSIDRHEFPYHFHGVVESLELQAMQSGTALYRLVIVPAFWQLTLSHHSRVFVNQTVPEIIEATLKRSGLTADQYILSLDGAYVPQEHVCQYKESNFHFVSRLMEREGIYYFFEQGDDQEKLVIADAASAHKELVQKPARYFHGGNDTSAGEAIEQLYARQSRVPKTVRMKDYDYVRPSLDVSGKADVSKHGHGQMVFYGDNFLTPAEGKRLAKVRAEELAAKELVFKGTGRVMHLRAGYQFTLEDHPRPSYNAKYLTTHLEHHGNQAAHMPTAKKLLGIEYDDVYRVNLVCIPADTQFRPERTTPSPRIYGLEEAVIDAEDGHPYSEIDSHGRYKVKINFDESDLDDGKASTWVRMLQPHGGDVEGFHFPLRKGTEVLLSFVGGDPDRPVISGVAHNATNPSAVTGTNNTKNVMQTGGSNRYEMEDVEGEQYIHMSTPTQSSFFFIGAIGKEPFNLMAKTNGTGQLYTGGLLDVKVFSTKTEYVKAAVTETFDATKSETVKALVTETYNLGHTKTVNGAIAAHTANVGMSLSVNGGMMTEKFTGGLTTTVTAKGEKRDITDHQDVTIHGKKHETVEADYVIDVTGGNFEQTISGDVKIQCAKYEVLKKGDSKLTVLGMTTDVHTGMSSETFIGFKNENFIGGKVETFVGAKAELTLAVTASISVSANLELSASVSLEGHVGPKLELKSAHIHNTGVEAKAAEAKLEACATKLETLGSKVVVAGVFIIL